MLEINLLAIFWDKIMTKDSSGSRSNVNLSAIMNSTVLLYEWLQGNRNKVEEFVVCNWGMVDGLQWRDLDQSPNQISHRL